MLAAIPDISVGLKKLGTGGARLDGRRGAIRGNIGGVRAGEGGDGGGGHRRLVQPAVGAPAVASAERESKCLASRMEKGGAAAARMGRPSVGAGGHECAISLRICRSLARLFSTTTALSVSSQRRLFSAPSRATTAAPSKAGWAAAASACGNWSSEDCRLEERVGAADAAADDEPCASMTRRKHASRKGGVMGQNLMQKRSCGSSTTAGARASSCTPSHRIGK